MGELLGRQAELALLENFLDRCSERPSDLAIEGEPGIGKTALWREVTRRAKSRGIRVLACRAAEAEAKLSFSGLADLLEPVPVEVLDDLPPPQRRALDVALLRIDPEASPPDTRAVATAFRSALIGLAASPTLVAIDDAHWLDSSSARAIEFAFRRRGAARVGLLVSRRVGIAALQTVLSEAEVLQVGPLSLGVIHDLLKSRLGRSLPRPLLLRVHEAARGNPFYALEIGREVAGANLQPGDPLPVPRDLSHLVQQRIARLSRGTREALLAAAISGSPTDNLVAAVLGRGALSSLEEAERVGLVEIRRGAIRFSHPLFAAAVQALATRRERRQLHRRLAEVIEEPEEHARHLALAAEGSDELVASALDEAAAAAKARGAWDASAELTEYAVQFTPVEAAAEAAERSLQLGIALRLAGHTERAAQVLDLLASQTSGSMRARALVERAAVTYWTEGALPALECCERALEAARGDIAVEAKVLADLAVYCEIDLDRSYDYAQRALRLFDRLGAAADSFAYSEALAISAGRSLMLGRGLPLPELDRALELEAKAERGKGDEAVVGRVATASGQWLKYVDDFDGARERLERARRAAVEEGDESALPNILVHLAQTELWSGNWELASRHAEESCEIAEQLGQNYGGPPAWRALVDAHLGRAERARQTAAAGLEAGAPNVLGECMCVRALGFLDLSQGKVEAAARQLTRALGLMERIRILEPGVLRIHADAVEALIAAGDLKQAQRILAPWEAQARRVYLAWSLATSARCRALLDAADGRAEDAFGAIATALGAHERLRMPFELGRTLLVKGQLERRSKRKAAAKESLEQALAIFDQLGARLWSEKAQAELDRIGLRRAASDDLTEGERRVAELAASGLTNREVAAQLFMSPKTVEANLARAYRKLGIHSRAELGARLASAGRQPTQT